MYSFAAPATNSGVKTTKRVLTIEILTIESLVVEVLVIEVPKRGGNLRSTILILSLVLGVVPLAGVAWILMSGMITFSPPSATVDGLFMTLILLTLSLCFLLNAYWELRDRGMIGKSTVGKKEAAPVKTPAVKAN